LLLLWRPAGATAARWQEAGWRVYLHPTHGWEHFEMTCELHQDEPGDVCLKLLSRGLDALFDGMELRFWRGSGD